jgi:Flp pilus assembly protein TadD
MKTGIAFRGGRGRGAPLGRAARAGILAGALALSACSASDGTSGFGQAGREAPGSAATGEGAVSVTVALDIAARMRAEGNLPGAISFYRRALALDPDRPKTLDALGDTLLEAGAPNEAAEAFNRALEKAPADPHALGGMGMTLVALDQPTRARELLTKANSIRPEAKTYGAIGVADDLTGDYKAATEAYGQGLVLAPHDLNLRNNLGLSQALSGDTETAIETLRRVAADPHATARHRLNLALVLGLAGRLQDAAQVARIDLDERAVRSNLVYYMTLRALPPADRAEAIFRAGARLPQPSSSGPCGGPSCALSAAKPAEAAQAGEAPMQAVPITPVEIAPAK